MADEFIKSQKTEIISAKRNNEGNIEIDMNTKMVLEDRNQAIETEITNNGTSLANKITMFGERNNMIKDTPSKIPDIDNNMKNDEISTLEAFVTKYPIETVTCAGALTILDVVLLVVCFYGMPDVSEFSIRQLPVFSFICMFVTCVVTCIKQGAVMNML